MQQKKTLERSFETTSGRGRGVGLSGGCQGGRV